MQMDENMKEKMQLKKMDKNETEIYLNNIKKRKKWNIILPNLVAKRTEKT